MQIEVLFFGITTDIVGKKSIFLDFSIGMTIADVKEKLLTTYPRLKNHNSFSIALNMEYATGEVAINSGDVIALIPPVSGG